MKYRLIFLASFLSLLYERVWSSFWPALSLLAAYAALSLLNAVEFFGPRVHAALLFIAACALAQALARPFRFPRVSDVERRIEAESALHHRPLAALHDWPVENLSVASLALWEKHIAGMRGLRDKMRVSRPRPGVARQDKYGLRLVAFVLLFTGVAVAGGDAGNRLARGLHPGVALDLGLEKPVLDAWLSPPDYTRLPPLFLASSQPGLAVAGGDVSVPEGSVLKIRVAGDRAPRLRLAGKSLPFTRASANSWIAAAPVTESGMLRVRQGVGDLGAWRIAVTPDAAPAVSITKVEATPLAALKIFYKAHDDYGVVKLTGTVSPPETLPPEERGRIVNFDMTVPPQDKEENTFTVDLSSNIRAGQQAMLALTALDGAGNVVSTEPFPIILPERKFNNPLAQKLIAARKSLVKAKDPISRKAIAETLSDAAANPSLYNGDIVIFMALGSAVRRLVYDSTPEGLMSVQDLLWDAALKLEDGGMSVAARDLAESLEKLSAMLDDKNTPKEALQKQLDEVQKNMQAWMQGLVAELAQRLQNGKGTAMLPPDMAKKFSRNIDITDLLRRMQQMAQGGSREDMQRMAQSLKNAIENMDMSKLGQPTPQQMEAMQGLQDLQEIIRRQQTLEDRTGRLDPASKGKEEAKEQDALRRKLGDVARKLGEALKDVPENLANADRAMKSAQEAFKNGKPRDSLPHQKTAVDELQKGSDGAIKALSDSMQQMILSFGLSPGGGSGNFGAGFDPLGRGEKGEGGQGGDIRIPDAAERRRVQEIIDELRRRSNDYQRPKVERDYLDRLLDQMN